MLIKSIAQAFIVTTLVTGCTSTGSSTTDTPVADDVVESEVSTTTISEEAPVPDVTGPAKAVKGKGKGKKMSPHAKKDKRSGAHKQRPARKKAATPAAQE